MKKSASEQPSIPFSNVVRSEFIKIISNPTIVIFIFITAILNIGLAILDTSGLVFYPGNDMSPSTVADFGVVMFAPIYAFLILPVYAASSEHQGGQNRMTLIAVPNRQRLMTGKVVAVVLAILCGILVTVIPSRLILNIFSDAGMSHILIDLTRWAAVYLLMSIIAFSIAGITRSTIVPLSILIMIPIFIATGILQWPEGLRFLPDQASMSLLGTPAYEVTELSPWIAFFTLLVWGLICTIVYWLSFLQRDS
ncbi:ABC transporter permease family protein [Oceanobacillus jeddahense]|uniref:ABC transporter permease n=1 Tax=Oceanobacillus jeddahense TaxID=1462527 RepID=A0ABY5JLL9_9BACI|nr:hypothetical protein [Oceanobacillus jeddahense]UUI01202.1 hypothetical protein NP439_14155 [Oceanobacillus jeddahense]